MNIQLDDDTSTYKTHVYTNMTHIYEKNTSRYFSLYSHVYAGMCVYLPVFHVFDKKGFSTNMTYRHIQHCINLHVFAL